MSRADTPKRAYRCPPSSRERAEALLAWAKMLTEQAAAEVLPMRQKVLRDGARKATELAGAELRFALASRDLPDSRPEQDRGGAEAGRAA